jgi:hypothetical protein
MGKNKRNNQYERLQGKRPAVGNQPVSISFSWAKLDPTQGQTIKEWEDVKLLAKFDEKLRQIGQLSKEEALAKQLIKIYPDFSFSENSNFQEPNHINPPENWAVIHIQSKEVVAGYLEGDVFYIVFLDKNHDFWKTDLQSRGKNRK